MTRFMVGFVVKGYFFLTRRLKGMFTAIDSYVNIESLSENSFRFPSALDTFHKQFFEVKTVNLNGDRLGKRFSQWNHFSFIKIGNDPVDAVSFPDSAQRVKQVSRRFFQCTGFCPKGNSAHLFF